MAAKVMMVAVPTVLGIASIRVYSVTEASPDGLVTREKLNIYTPVSKSPQVQIVPERPGLIENGLTTARERILPFAQAVKGACVSVKTGSVNLYHAGEDVYYYLKDPPPGFLPRFGTVTMAGLLGMVLARKGSRFKQMAVPLGLMSAGASVCYPAQAVAVLKVTGKKVYAAGQWSSAAVSSLLASKPLEPVDNKTAASQPQSSTESAVVEEPGSAHMATIPEPEEASAESVSASDDHGVAVISEEASLVTLTEITSNQAPTETNTDSDPPKTETTTRSEEPPFTKKAPEIFAPEPSPPTIEETLVPKSSNEPAVPVIESVEVDVANLPPLITVGETPTAPPPEQPAAESQKAGSGFKPDPSIMDFGQSSPEDEDLYSTRS